MNKGICFEKAVLAGMCISIGCICYLSLENKIAGAVLFAVGLISILTYDLRLYTGMIGRARTREDLWQCAIALAGNICGSVCMYVLVRATPIYQKNVLNLQMICENKMNIPLSEMFFLGVICGMLMLFATKKKDNFLLSVMCVAAFILIGAEHSVADAFYLLESGTVIRYLIVVLVVAAGNAAGAQIASRMIDAKEK